MSRTFIVRVGVLLWTLVAIDAGVHVLTGAWTTAAMMVMIAATWITLRRASWSPLKSQGRLDASVLQR